MAPLHLRVLTSPAELREAAPQWDRLWQASDCTLPSLQANTLAVELEHFRPLGAHRLFVVEQGGQFLGALPVIDQRGVPGWRVGSVTGNCWSPSCDLLVDRQCDLTPVLERLLDGVCAAHWPLVDFHAVDLTLPRWQAWREAIDRRGLECLQTERIAIGVLRIEGTWDEYCARLTRNHRRQMRRMVRKCDAWGGAALRVERAVAPDDVAPLLRRGFEVENSSWKGSQGSSVLATEGKLAFYTDQARTLAAKGQLQLAFLEVGGEPAAFEYGWLSKGVYYAVKVGYDERRAEATPGQLLRWLLFERLHNEGCWRTIDFVGPITRALSSWSNGDYKLSRLVVAPRRLSGRLALATYRALRPLLRSKDQPPQPEPQVPAEPDSPADLALAEA